MSNELQQQHEGLGGGKLGLRKGERSTSTSPCPSPNPDPQNCHRQQSENRVQIDQKSDCAIPLGELGPGEPYRMRRQVQAGPLMRLRRSDFARAAHVTLFVWGSCPNITLAGGRGEGGRSESEPPELLPSHCGCDVSTHCVFGHGRVCNCGWLTRRRFGAHALTASRQQSTNLAKYRRAATSGFGTKEKPWSVLFILLTGRTVDPCAQARP